MIYSIQNTILEIDDFISSFNPGIYFIVSVAAIIFSCYMLYSIFVHRDFGERTKSEKVIFIPALVISLVFILDMILAGDVYPNLSAEKIARFFAEDLCKGKIREITKENAILAPEYRERFAKEWGLESKGFSDICGYSKADDFLLIEYHYKRSDLPYIEDCTVVLRTWDYLNVDEYIRKEEDLIERDIDFKIHLTKIGISSRFCGMYMRWRISGFYYTKSKAITIKE